MGFNLQQNFPNPFNPSTTIQFSLPKNGHASLQICNLLGEEVATLVSGDLQAGQHSIRWDATGKPSGVYFYRLQAGQFTETKKLVLLR
jgi:flagellar hook assembly protein FlgD